MDEVFKYEISTLFHAQFLLISHKEVSWHVFVPCHINRVSDRILRSIKLFGENLKIYHPLYDPSCEYSVERPRSVRYLVEVIAVKCFYE